jgi:hypothetical protein
MSYADLYVTIKEVAESILSAVSFLFKVYVKITLLTSYDNYHIRLHKLAE